MKNWLYMTKKEKHTKLSAKTMYKRNILCIILSGFLLTGCASMQASPNRDIQLSHVYDIQNNVSDSEQIQITDDVSKALQEQNLTDSDLLDGYRWVECKGVSGGWKYSICTMENEHFVYRNMEYYIPVYEGDDYILYQIPGQCDDYMIFQYTNGGDTFEN